MKVTQFPIMKSSPDTEVWSLSGPTLSIRSVSTHIGAILTTAKALRDSPLWIPISNWLLKTSNFSLYVKLMLAASYARIGSRFLGKLSRKVEPAGKIRIFAMVDPWTQWIFRPLHLKIFSLLRPLSTDGTFNQLAPVHRLLERVGPVPELYSYDLSAATDRLPILLQTFIIRSKFYGLEEDWAKILVARDYWLKVSVRELSDIPLEAYRERWNNEMGNQFIALRYAAGQPMGALSSWAMLALTHHFIVQ